MTVGGPPAPPTRATYRFLAMLWLLVIVSGSLAPFTFALPPRAFEPLHLVGLSISDFVSNVALFVPLGFFLAGAWRPDRDPSSLQMTITPVLIALASAVAGACIESGQRFIPSRTASMNDVSAQLLGGTAGALLWTRLGDHATATIGRSTTAYREAPTGIRVLGIYAVVWVVIQLFPFDATLRVTELAHKVREGRLALIPFESGWHPLPLIIDLAAAAPVGAVTTLAVVRHEGGLSWRAVRCAFGAATVIVAATNAGRALMDSRTADATECVAATAGAACGVLLARLAL